MQTIHNFNITIFGDSISKGLFLKDDKIEKIDRPAVKILKDNLSLNIDNKSVFGQTLKRVYEKGMIDKYLSEIDVLENNMVVLSLGGNDSDFNWQEVENSPLDFHSSKTSLAEFSGILNSVIYKLQERGVEVVVCSLFPVDAKRYFNNVLSKKYDQEKLFEFLNHDITNISRHQEIFSTECLKVAMKNHCRFLDFRSELLSRKDFLSFVCDDGIHPNQNGHKMIADFVTAKIQNQTNRPLIFNAKCNVVRLWFY